MIRRKVHSAFALGVVVFFTGCATYRVQVQASRTEADPVSGRAYILDLPSSQVRSPQFLAATRALQTALEHRGFVPAENRDAASLIVRFSFRAENIGHDVTYRSVSRDVVSGPISLTPRPAGAAPVATREVSLARGIEARYLVSIIVAARDAKTDLELWRVDALASIPAAARDDILDYLVAAAEPALDPTANSSGEVALEHGHARVRALRSGS